jgi:hypothetical protein
LTENTNPNEPVGEVTADFFFAIIPEWVLALPVSSNAIRTYCVLRRFADNNTGECYPSRRLLSMKARLSVSTLDRAIKELVDAGAVKVKPRKNASGDWSSNLYTVIAFPNGVSPSASRPLFTVDRTGVPTGGERTKAIRTISNNTRSHSSADIERDNAIGLGNAYAMTGKSRDDLVELLDSRPQAFIDIALEAYDSRKPQSKPKQKAKAPEWQDKYDT